MICNNLFLEIRYVDKLDSPDSQKLEKCELISLEKKKAVISLDCRFEERTIEEKKAWQPKTKRDLKKALPDHEIKEAEL